MCKEGPVSLINLFKISNFQNLFHECSITSQVQRHTKKVKSKKRVKVINNRAQLHKTSLNTVQSLMVSYNAIVN